MSDPRIRLKINLWHDVRDHDKGVSKIEEMVERKLNHSNKCVENVRISYGYSASAGAVFVTLSDRRFSINDMTSSFRLKGIISKTIDAMEQYGYASNIQEGKIRIEAISV